MNVQEILGLKNNMAMPTHQPQRAAEVSKPMFGGGSEALRALRRPAPQQVFKPELPEIEEEETTLQSIISEKPPIKEVREYFRQKIEELSAAEEAF